MKKIVNKNSLIMLLLLMILSACGANNGENTNTTVSTNETGQDEEVSENSVRITISIDNGSQYINESEVEIEEGEKLLDVLRKSFYVETNERNEVISIERMAVNEAENTTWVLYIDGQQSTEPISDYILKSGEKITLDLQ